MNSPEFTTHAEGKRPLIRSRVSARVNEVQAYGEYIRLRLRVPGWPGAPAGSFSLLQTELSRCFLPRPYSVHCEGGDGGTDGDRVGVSREDVDFLVDPVGPASRELASVAPGDRVWVLGPLGRGFELGEICARPRAVALCPAAGVRGKGFRLVLVAGGVGVAPFPLLLQQLASVAAAEPGEAVGVPSEVVVLAGFRDAGQAAAVRTLDETTESLRRSGVPSRVLVTTEDGSVGRSGLVTGAAEEEVRAGDRVAACGPHGMAEAVWRICATAGAPAWFSLEARMACGVGSCHGCVLRMADGRLVRVCRRGPVMRGEEAFGALDAAV